MIYKLYPTSLKGHLRLVSSKSASHRYLIAAALSNEHSIIENVLNCKDTEATINGLKALGANINLPFINKGNFNGVEDEEIVIDCNESGSTLRFLIPLALLHNKKIIFDGKNQLKTRPVDTYFKLAKEHNFTIEKMTDEANLPLYVKGPLKAGKYYVEGHISSQFLTGLIFALITLKEDSKIILTTPLESKDYVLLTISILEEFGIKVNYSDKEIYIKGNQTIKNIAARVEGDFSQSAFWLVAGVINGDITLSEVNLNSSQGDKKVINILQQMKADIEVSNQTLIAKKSETNPIEIDLTHTPDLGPILMILAGLTKGTTSFKGLSRLKIKESDRLGVLIDILNKFGVKTTLDNDLLEITGVNTFKGGHTFETHNDHRIAMALAIAALRADSPIFIKEPFVVDKSYPQFFIDYAKVGGKYEEVK